MGRAKEDRNSDTAYIVGLDIGGANLKLADSSGRAASRPFAVWRAPQRLADELVTFLAACPVPEKLAVTMTAELCDCFVSKDEGVQAVLAAVEHALETLAWANCRTLVWTTRGQFVPLARARLEPSSVAAANWLALAQWAARLIEPATALLIDVGSTTTDIVLLHRGTVRADGLEDVTRLISRELLYLGVRRTPVAMLVGSVPWRGRMVPVARELFATVGDAFLLTGDLPEDPACCETADGRPMTRLCAAQRLARTMCLDADRFEPQELARIAEHVAAAACAELCRAIATRLRAARSAVEQVIVAGEGEFLARQALSQLGWRRPVLALGELAGEMISRCGPAWALVQLARGAAHGGRGA